MKEIFTLREDENLIRLDVYLSNKLELSRSKIQSLIESGNISLNGNKTKASVKLKAGDKIYVQLALGTAFSAIIISTCSPLLSL